MAVGEPGRRGRGEVGRSGIGRDRVEACGTGATPPEGAVAAGRGTVPGIPALAAAALALAAASALAAGPAPAAAQAREAAVDSVPSPREHHGFDPGERYLNTAQVYGYYERLAATSDRVAYRSYGRSIQGRELPLLIVGSRENLGRLEEIRRNAARLAGATEPLSEGELERLTAETPAVVWLYVVDTTEEAGVNALQEVAYELATAEDAATRSVRDSVLVVMAPFANPDAHARYVSWHKMYNVEGAALDPNAVENEAHWGVNTDGNAWGLDVNRDFGWFESPEMRALAETAMAWNPQFWADIHSGPDVMFMPPFGRPYDPLWPEQAPGWWDAVAERASEAFGRRGWSFSSRGYEGATTPGISRSWGMLGPSVAGFLYESFGGRPGKTTAFRRSDGTVATLRMAMDRHKLAVRSLLEVARDRKSELLRDAHRRTLDAVEGARESEVRSVVIPASGPELDPARAARVVRRLDAQGIEVGRATEAFTGPAAPFAEPGEREPREFGVGSYVIDLVQPRARLARRLLDPTVQPGVPEVDVPFPGRVPHTYVTWSSYPHLFGVPAYALGSEVAAAVEPAGEPAGPQAEIDRLDEDEPAYAWLLPAEGEASYRAAIALLEEGYRLRVFKGRTTVRGERYPKGTMALLRGRNPEGVGRRAREVAREEGADLVEVAGPYTESGVTFGDDGQLAPVPEPRVAVLSDRPVAHDHVYGGIRTVLEGIFGLTFSPVMRSTINERDLSKYTAVVLPHAGMSIRGGPNFSRGYRGRLEMGNLREYVRGGGTLLAVKGAAETLAADSVLGRDVRSDGWARRTSGAVLRARWSAGLRTDSTVMRWRPGLDRVGFPLLAASYEREDFPAPGAYPVLLGLREGGEAEAEARYGSEPGELLLDGFMLDGDREEIAGRPFVAVQPVGEGRVVYFADSPTFRARWYGLNPLYLNTVLFGPTL